jgi:uncharacterized protein YndB with AHSA1/START domain
MMNMENQPEKTIVINTTVPAPLSEAWKAWTTEAGAKTFFAPQCKIELQPGGAYEMYFNLDVPAGERGGEGMIVLSFQPERMLSFTWNNPPSLPSVRGEMTHVVVRFAEADPNTTQITLIHDGWGEGGEWEQAYEYFIRAWGEVVLPRLKYRFEHGPVDWDDLPDLLIT